MGQTIAEKVMSRHNLLGKPAVAGELIDASVDALMSSKNTQQTFGKSP